VIWANTDAVTANCLLASYSAACKATECADKIFVGQNFTPARLHVKKWRGQNFADKRAKFAAAAIITAPKSASG